MKKTFYWQKIILLAGDLAILFIALFLSLKLRYGNSFYDWTMHWRAFIPIFALWVIIFYLSDLYRIDKISKIEFLIRAFIQSIFIASVFSIIYFYLSPTLKITPKTILIILTVVSFILLFIWRVCFNLLTRKLRIIKKVLIIGLDQPQLEAAWAIIKKKGLGYHLLGFIDAKTAKRIKKLPAQILGNLNKTADIIQQQKPDLIVLSLDDFKNNDQMLKDVSESMIFGTQIVDLPVFYEELSEKVPINQLSQMWFINNIQESEKKEQEIAKRIIDIICSMVGLLCFAVLLPVLIILIKLEDHGPVFYRQKRVGAGGKVFILYKLRTMRKNAEARFGAVWAKDHDSRITKIGRFLRKTRLDEVPQLWNVLKGDMSLVGPRPERPEFIEKLEKQIPFYSRRNLIKPGLTGWAQIHYGYGASVGDSLEKLQYDLYYIKNRSLWLDCTIALKTIVIVMSLKGK